MEFSNNNNLLCTTFSDDEQSVIVLRNTVLTNETKNLFVTYMQQVEYQFLGDGSEAEIAKFKEKILEAIEDFTIDTQYIILDTLYKTSIKFNKQAVNRYPFGITDPYNFVITINNNSFYEQPQILTVYKDQPIVINQWNVRNIESFIYTDYTTKESITLDIPSKITFNAGILKRTYPALFLKSNSIAIANSYDNKPLLEIQYKAGYLNNILTTLPEDILRCVSFSAWQRYRQEQGECDSKYQLEIVDIKNKYITTLQKKISNSFVYINDNGYC